MEVDKKEIEIVIRKKTFKISFVSNWVVYQYDKLNSKLTELQSLYDQLQLFPPKDEIQEIVEKIKELGSNSLNERLDVVKEILEGNDIEYDRKWWERKTDANDISRFITTCVFKDASTSKKKVQEK